MMPKLPEPDDSSTEIETGTAAYWFRLETVRAIQEEAYRAGMAAAVPDYPTVYKWAQDSGFIADGQLDDFIYYIIDKLAVSPEVK
jgi:hypothetical protein